MITSCSGIWNSFNIGDCLVFLMLKLSSFTAFENDSYGTNSKFDSLVAFSMKGTTYLESLRCGAEFNSPPSWDLVL